jgi:hypothetical protein
MSYNYLFRMPYNPLFRTFSPSFFLLLFLLTSVTTFAQNKPGPAGVGNQLGTNGQPKIALWLDASTLSLSDGEDISSWTDVSGNDNHATQANTANMPVYVSNILNNKPGIRFRPATPNRTQTFLEYDGSHFIGNPYAIFAVAARRANGGNYIMGGSATSGNQNLHWGWRDNNNFTQAQYGNDINATLADNTVGNFSIISSSRNNLTTPFARNITQNGTILPISGNTTTTNLLTSYNNPYIGRYQNNYYQIDLAELIQYSSFLNHAQQLIVDNYLSLKYGISLGSRQFFSHASYTHELIGVGSSDGVQKHKASSASSGGLWLRESGESFDENDEFVFAAHNGMAPGETTLDLPGLPGDDELTGRSARSWYLQRSASTNTTINLGFTIDDIGLASGAANQVFYLLYRADEGDAFSLIPGAIGVLSEGVVWVTVANHNLSDGYYTLARSNQTGRTWYSYKNGDWDDWQTWSLEQGGTDFINPGENTPTDSPTADIDRVVINAGHRVTITSHDKQNIRLDVENGIADFGITTGHFFPVISGKSQGTIRLMADNFPGGNATEFHAVTGGTVEYYGHGYTLGTSRDFNNMRIALQDNSSQITLLADYHLKGNMEVERGIFRINDNAGTDVLNLTILGDLEVKRNGQIGVGEGNSAGTRSIPWDSAPNNMPPIGQYHRIFHQVTLGGNLTNDGTIRFTNQTVPHYSQFTYTGAATFTFTGTTNARAELNGTSDFYNLIIDKGIDQTFELELYAQQIEYFRLFGPNNAGRQEGAPFTPANPEIRKALWVRNGTLKLTGSIHIPSLSEGDRAGGNGDYAIPANGALWIAGPDVTVFTTARSDSPDLIPGTDGLNDGGSNQAMSLLGKFRITDGYFSTRNSAGFIFWNASSAMVEILGGLVDASQFRSAASVSDGKTTFFMSGGELLVRSNLNNFVHNGQTILTGGGDTSGNYPIFGMVDSLGVFNMSGGTVYIYRSVGNNNYNSNGVYINTKPINHSVTGGTIELIGYDENRNYDIISTGNLYNLTIRQTRTDRTTRVYMGSDLHLEGNLTINNRTELFARREHGNFNDDSHDLKVARTFTIQTTGNYFPFQNTTTLLATYDVSSFFYHPDPVFYNLVIENHPTLPATRRRIRNSAVLIQSDLTIKTGSTLRHENQNITVRGNIFNSGVIEHANAANTGNVIATQRGIVKSIGVTNAGSHTSIPDITLQAPPSGGVQATAVPVFNGVPAADNALPLAGILVTNTGSGYITAPTVSISTGGAAATAQLSLTHELGGNGSGTFANLAIDEPHPNESGGKQETTFLTSNQRITKTLTLTNGILDIRSQNLIIEGSLHSEVIGDFSISRMIRTNGHHSDLGISRKITSNGNYVYPFGIFTKTNNGSRLTPTMQTISDLPADVSGFVQINPVDNELPTLSSSSHSALQIYWRVRHSGFSQMPRTLNRFYFFDTPNAYFAGSGNPNSWEPGKIVNLVRTYNHGPLDWDNGTKNLVLNYTHQGGGETGNNPPFLEEGEFTSGHSQRFSGTVKVFYLRANGGWRTNGTWSLTRGGSSVNDYPKAGDIAVIRRLAANYSGFVEITNAETCAKLIFDDENGFSSGSPRVRFSNSASFGSNFPVVEVAATHQGGLDGINDGERHGAVLQFDLFTGYSGQFPAGDFGDFFNYPNALVLFRNVGTTNPVPLPPSITEYPQIWFDPPNNKTFLLPNAHVTFNGLVIIPYGHDLIMNTGSNSGVTFKKRLSIGSNSLGSGTFSIRGNSTENKTIEALGDIRLVNSNSHLRILNPVNGQRTHQLIAHGNISLASGCSINLGDGNTANTNVELIIKGSGNSTFSTEGAASADFYRIIMDKGSNNTPRFTFNSSFDLHGPTNGSTKALELRNGSLVLNHPDIDITLSSGGSDFYIPSTSALMIHSGKAGITSPGSNGILLDGLLEIRNSTSELTLDGGPGSDNYIEYSSSGNAVIRVEQSGKLTVGSQIRGSLINDAGKLRYHQMGGNPQVIVGKNSAPNGSRGVFEIHNPGSHLQIYNGSLTIARGHDNPATASRAALHINPDRQGLNEWGKFVIGDGSNTSEIAIYSSIELPSVDVKAHATAKTWLSPLTIFGTLHVETNGVFNGNGLNLSVRKNFINNGTAALGTDTLFMLSKDNSNYLRGNITINHLVLEPTVSVYLFNGSSLNVNGNLKLASGTFEDNGLTVNVGGHIVNNATHISTGTGSLLLNGSSLQIISGYGQFGNLHLNNAAGAELANDLNMENTLTLTNGIFNTRNHLLSLGQYATIAGSDFSVNKMIATSGSFADKGIRRYVGSGATDMLFPLGVVAGTGNKYTPVSLSITQNLNPGYVRMYPVNQAHMTTVGPNVLQYYWTVESSGLSGMDAMMKFKYLNADVRGAESDYIAARLEEDGWAKFPTTFVNETTDSISFLFASVSNISGDYTAGIDPHLPDQIPVFTSTGSGGWSDVTRWSRSDGGEIPEGGPNGHIVHIREGDVINLDRFRVLAYRTNLNGRLEIGTQAGHNLGRIEGSGTLAVEEGKLPTGILTAFMAAATGSTIEYGGDTGYNIPDIRVYGLGSNTYNNLTITGNGVKSLPGATVVVRDNLSILETATFASSLYVRVGRNLHKSPTSFFVPGSYFDFNGSVAQLVTGNFTGENAFYNLWIRNNSGVSFASDVEISNITYLDYGKITMLNSSTFTISKTLNGSSLNNYYGSWVEGRMTRKFGHGSNYLFMAGKGNKPHYVTLNNVTHGSGTKEWTVEYFDSNPTAAGMDPEEFDAPLQRISDREYWRIDGPSPGSAHVNLHYGPYSMVSDDTGNLNTTVVAIWDGSTWVNKGGPATSMGGGFGYVSSAIVSTFSTQYFTLGTTHENNPLPIELISFTATIDQGNVLLDWVTASEINNDYFTIERSTDGVNFEIVAIIASQAPNGYSNQFLEYTAVDMQPIEGISYYRLKQTDYDGSFEYSDLVDVNFRNQDEVALKLFPNPNRGNSFNVYITNLLPHETIDVTITDLNGRNHFSTRYTVSGNGTLQAHIIPSGKLPPGVYMVSFAGTTVRVFERMVVN